MTGQDIIGQAQTGTGKTASFGIPMLQKVDPKNKHVQAIVLCPTRELAIQSADEIRKLAKFMHGIKVLPIYGGQDYGRQIRALKRGTHVVVATPGRALDHISRGTLNLSSVKAVVLDEADEMLDLGFADELDSISMLCLKRCRRRFFPPRCRPVLRALQKIDSIRLSELLLPRKQRLKVKHPLSLRSPM